MIEGIREGRRIICCGNRKLFSIQKHGENIFLLFLSNSTKKRNHPKDKFAFYMSS